VLAGGSALRQFENRYICRDGSVRWLQWNTRPATTLGLVAAAARDITDSMRRRDQAALRRVATVVARGAAPSDVFTTVAAEIADLLNADLTLIGRYETDATFSYLAAGGPMQTSSPLGDRLNLGGDHLASNILRSGHPESMSYDDASGPIAVFARIPECISESVIDDGTVELDTDVRLECGELQDNYHVNIPMTGHITRRRPQRLR
jgi:hypothetical protein